MYLYLEKFLWQKPSIYNYCLLPLSALYLLLLLMRKYLYKLAIFKIHSPPIPFIVIGNITSGGNGKTPLLIETVKYLNKPKKNSKAGYRVGVVTKGYPVCSTKPQIIDINSKPHEVGDEPILIHSYTQVPVVACKSRIKGIEHLLNNFELDIIISDDGMQDYSIERTLEIATVDSAHNYNTFLLPAGPYREPIIRLASCSAVVSNEGLILSNEKPPFNRNSFASSRVLSHIKSPQSKKNLTLSSWKNKQAIATTAIARPTRFFDSLTDFGIILKHTFAFPDHYHFTSLDLEAMARHHLPIIMTEKDIVKCYDLVEKFKLYVAILSFTVEEHYFNWLDNEVSVAMNVTVRQNDHSTHNGGIDK